MRLLNSKDIEGDITQKEKINFIKIILELLNLTVPKRLDKTIADLENYLLARPKLKDVLNRLYDAKFRH